MYGVLHAIDAGYYVYVLVTCGNKEICAYLTRICMHLTKRARTQ